MPQIIEVPGHGQVEFPDGMSDEQISSAIKKNMLVGTGNIPKPEIPKSSTFGENLIGGLYEPLAKMATGMIAKPISEISGLAATGYEAATGNKNSADMPGQFKNSIQDALTYEPKTDLGKTIFNPLNAIPSGIGAVIGAPGKLAAYGLGKVGAPEWAKSGTEETLNQVIPILGSKYAQKLSENAQSNLGQVKQNLADKAKANALEDEAFKAAKEAKYKFSPAEASPGVVNNLLEGIAGKGKTQQSVSLDNTTISNGLIRKELGLSNDVPLSAENYQAVRAKYSPAYDALRNTGKVNADAGYFKALDDIKAPFENAAKSYPKAKPNPIIDEIKSLKENSFDASGAVDMIGELRGLSDKAFKQNDGTLGRSYRKAAQAIDDQLSRHLETSKQPQSLIDDYHLAREKIAQSYVAQKATDLRSGNVIPSKIGDMAKRGDYLTGGLKTIGQATNFEKSLQAKSKIGGVPSIAPIEAGMGGTLSAIGHNPLYTLASAIPSAMRGIITSDFYQKHMVTPPTYKPSLLQSSLPSIYEGAGKSSLVSPYLINEQNKQRGLLAR